MSRGFWLAMILCACGPTADSERDGGGGGGDGGVDGGTQCQDGDFTCFGNVFQRCQDGHFVDQATCTAPQICDEDLGCAACRPELNTCVGEEVHSCTADGNIGDLVETCSGDASCEGGACRDLCGDAAAARSYIGCEYWAVDLHNAVEVLSEADPFFGGCDLLGIPGAKEVSIPVCYNPTPPGFFDPTVAGLCDNGSDCSGSPGFSCEVTDVCILDAQGSPFAIVVANPSLSATAIVTVQNATGMTQTVNVPPGQVEAIFPQTMGFPDQSIAWSALDEKAYRVTSNRPIVAYQFNPLDNVGVFSNDASLLLPAHTFDTKYYAVTLPTLERRPQAHDWNGYVTIVASEPGTTTVTVTPTAVVRQGTGVPPLVPMMPQDFTMTEGQTLTLEAGPSGDLTGSLIESDNPIGVFAGTVASAPSTLANPCCADHLEDQLFPASTWGKEFAIARSLPRMGEPDRLRIIAQMDDTTVTLTPASGSCPVLDAGDFCEVDIAGHVEISATQPILVAHLLLAVGQAGDFANPQGDPSLSFAVPSEQFRTQYQLLVPQQYSSNFFAVVTPAGGTVVLDGADVTALLSGFASGSFIAGQLTVNGGAHTLECPLGCGVEVGGYGDAVSYLFAGGLDLEQIVVED